MSWVQASSSHGECSCAAKVCTCTVDCQCGMSWGRGCLYLQTQHRLGVEPSHWLHSLNMLADVNLVIQYNKKHSFLSCLPTNGECKAFTQLRVNVIIHLSVLQTKINKLDPWIIEASLLYNCKSLLHKCAHHVYFHQQSHPHIDFVFYPELFPCQMLGTDYCIHVCIFFTVFTPYAILNSSYSILK